MGFEKIENFVLDDVLVTLDSDKKLFKDSEDKIYEVINDDSDKLKKDDKNKIVNEQIKTVLSVCKRSPKDTSLKDRYTDLKDEITEKLKIKVQDLNSFNESNYDSLKLNVNKVINNFNKVISLPESFSQLIPDFSWKDGKKKISLWEFFFNMFSQNDQPNKQQEELEENILDLKKKIETLKKDLTNPKLTWKKRLEESNMLVSSAEKLVKEAEGFRLNFELQRGKETVNDIKNEEIHFSKPLKDNKITAEMKLLIQKFDGDSIEFRKWWIMWALINSLSISEDIKKILFINNIKFDYNNPLPSDVKKTILLMDIKCLNNCIKYLTGDRNRIVGSIVNLKFSKAKSVGIDLLEYYLGGFEKIQTDAGFKVATKSLANDLEKALENTRDLIGCDIKKIKPDSSLIDKILSILKKCELSQEIKDSKGKPSELIEKSLIHYVDGGGGVSSNNMNALLRDTLNILQNDGLGEYFDIEVYKDLCSHVKTLTKAFKEDKDKSKGLINLTKKDMILYRGMDYKGLFEMFKNGNFKIPDSPENFNEEIISQINKENPIIFDKAFLSTSSKKSVALSFYTSVLLVIFAPKGTKSVDAQEKLLTKARNAVLENEFILPPNTKLRVEEFSVNSAATSHYNREKYDIIVKASVAK